MSVAGVVAFYILYAAAFCFFKRGSMSKSAWLPCFIVGNVFGGGATAIALGGGFLLTQMVTALIFTSNLSVFQYLGLGLIAAGLFAIIKGENKHKEETL